MTKSFIINTGACITRYYASDNTIYSFTLHQGPISLNEAGAPLTLGARGKLPLLSPLSAALHDSECYTQY